MADGTKQKRKTSASTASKTTGTKKASTKQKTTKKGKSNSPSSNGKQQRITLKPEKSLLRYEIELITLFAVTILSAVAIHTDKTGFFGGFLKAIYLGLFGFSGAMLTYLIFLIIFFQINRYFQEKKWRLVSAFLSLFMSVWLFSTTFNYGTIYEQLSQGGHILMSPEGLKLSFDQGVQLRGGGIIGNALVFALINAIGKFGVYLLATVFAALGIVLTFKVSLTNWVKQGGILTYKGIKPVAKKIQNMPKNVIKNVGEQTTLSPVGTTVEADQENLAEKPIEVFDSAHYFEDDNAENLVSGDTQKMAFAEASEQRDSILEEVAPREVIHPQTGEYLYGEAEIAALRAEQLTSEKEETEFETDETDLSEASENDHEAFEAYLRGESYPTIVHYDAEASEEYEDAEVAAANYEDEILMAEETFVETEDIFEAEEIVETYDDAKSEEVLENMAPLEKPVQVHQSEEPKVAVKPVIKPVVKPKPYMMPPLSLLNAPKGKVNQNRDEIVENVKTLETTLKNFGVDAKVTEVTKGPAITMYEVLPAPGVKVSKIVNLTDDIALALAAPQIRMIAPIPGKSAIGIEIPNKDTTMVTAREVFESEEFKKTDSKLSFALGKDITGKTIIADLAKMPHLLIAGSTGSGKSVCVNTIINSILFNAKPDEVKLMMIDPKVVELSHYNGIPHLILPVVVDPKKASIALNWAVNEMTNRYKSFAEHTVKDINTFNRKAESQPELKLEKMPKIVILVDELADLMMVAPNQVEDAICRLAQMARAAGIHLIVATQRPSVDVITGLIKANIPSRIAFAVSSQIDSRTILDMAGAEKLLGKGDMLFYPLGANKPVRVQGAFLADQEVEGVVGFVKEQLMEPANYQEEILQDYVEQTSTMEADEILPDVIDMVVDTGQASISMVQRKFKVGYSRAARLIDQMEERGIIGPSLGSKPREVLITKIELEQMKRKTSD